MRATNDDSEEAFKGGNLIEFLDALVDEQFQFQRRLTRGELIQASESRINRLTFQCENAEDTFMNSSQWLALNKTL